ncbi:RNA demethylase ALKBH5-like protein [Trifolium pratense]|uniref:RNA demethylase ALKBH5-like protein n=1 Tax=Trifolium pratense TaxID=57577 RepID=A0A2K3LD61_TRIPR|nr:RNA demethylase ALKBH5-like protein [Trifolium pratense]
MMKKMKKETVTAAEENGYGGGKTVRISKADDTMISITFRKMDERKLPYNFSPDPELVGIKPLINSPPKKPERNSETQIEKDQSFDQFEYNPVWKTRKESLRVKDEYPLPINGSFRRMRGNELAFNGELSRCLDTLTEYNRYLGTRMIPLQDSPRDAAYGLSIESYAAY